MKRFATVLAVLATWPLLTAGGGFNPPSFVPNAGRTTFSATIVLDPHMAQGDLVPDGAGGFVPLAADVTPPSSKHAYVVIGGKGQAGTSASFQVNSSFMLFRGCDLSLTDTRFLYTTATPSTMRGWVPPLALQALFLPLGITPNATNVPAITAIRSAECLPDPNNPGPIPNGGDGQPSIPGLLHMEVDIQILTP